MISVPPERVHDLGGCLGKTYRDPIRGKRAGFEVPCVSIAVERRSACRASCHIRNVKNAMVPMPKSSHSMKI